MSGGQDSIALAHIFSDLAVNFSIAHCNYQLRGEDSDDDERFVKKFAKQLRVNCYSERFATQNILDTEGGNSGICETESK